MEAATRRWAISAGSLGRALRRAFWPGLAWLVALVGVANLVVLLGQASALVHSLYLSADNATALVLPALSGHAPAGASVNLGNHPWYEPWWFMRATVGLPGYRQLWELAPFVSGLLGSAAVGACAWWALGRLAGLASAVTMFAASETQRGILYVPESHGLILLHLAALCGALLFVQRRAFSGRLTPRALALVGVPLVLFTGVGFTDQLALLSGLGPSILAPLVCWWRLRSPAWRSVSAFALATGILSGLLALLLTRVMQDDNVVHAVFPINFVGGEAMLTGLQNLLATLASLGGGDFFGGPASGANLLTFLAGALTLLALAAILKALWHWSAKVGAPVEPRATQTGSRELFVAFWGLVLVFVVAAFALTSVSASAGNGRYLVGAWAALAALLGILARTPVARAAVLAGVAVFGALNIRAELAAGVPPTGPGPSQALAGTIERYVLAHGASVGYGGYWDSSPVTWETKLRVTLFPIDQCGTPAGWCPFGGSQVNTWYAPRSNVRTFLLTDTRPGIPFEVTSPPAIFGRPVAEEGLGGGLTVYIYDHDLAANLGS
ncbi:MAG TPA: hypothetical protein VGX72_02655 [Solirubrobacteraceae bacterium]|nr:hypothetical protein [Solirubrobacteraceae bacterium]